MKILERLLFALVILSVPLFSRERVSGFCELGNKTITVAGVVSSPTTPIQRSYPTCTVTVFIKGSGMLANLYADDNGAGLANPFTVGTPPETVGNGYWFFYPDNGRYDVQISGAGIPAPFVFGDILAQDGFNTVGVWDNSGPSAPLIAGISSSPVTPASVDHDRFLMTNVYGSYLPNQECCRVQAITGLIHVPLTAITYEACAICGMIFATNPLVNNVALSGFAVPGASGPEGFANLNHTVLSKTSGPCFDPSWGHTINTLITVNHIDTFITSVANCNQLTILNDFGVLTNIPWSRRLFMWGENLGLSDDQPGATPAGPGYSHVQEMNEWDFGVYGPDTTVVALIFGVGGTQQPTGAHGIVINGGGPDLFGNPIRWNTAITTFSNCCGAFAEIGTGTSGNSGSQPIIAYARDSMGRVSATSLNTDEGGNFIIDTQTDASNTLNPAVIIRDTNQLNWAFTGSIGGARPTLSGFNNSAFVPGTTDFAHLGAGTPGEYIECTDCKNVISGHILAGSQCVNGGSGAVAMATFGGLWGCF